MAFGTLTSLAWVVDGENKHGSFNRSRHELLPRSGLAQRLYRQQLCGVCWILTQQV
jgi:hypothetical protein